jgi:hypothetical protein
VWLYYTAVPSKGICGFMTQLYLKKGICGKKKHVNKLHEVTNVKNGITETK